MDGDRTETRVSFPWTIPFDSPVCDSFPEEPVRAAFVFINGFVPIAILSLIAVVSGVPVVFPSLGPTAFLLFFTPTAATASPALVTGVDLARAFAAALSLAGTGALMILLRVPHPPAGATRLIISLGIIARPLHLLVLEVAVAALPLQAIVINRLAGLAVISNLLVSVAVEVSETIDPVQSFAGRTGPRAEFSRALPPGSRSSRPCRDARALKAPIARSGPKSSV